MARVMDEHPGLTRVGWVREYIGDVEVERLRLSETGPVQQQRDEHATVVLASSCMESLGKQFLETLFREGWRFTLLNSRQALAPDTVPGLGGGSVSRPGVPEEGLAAPVLVGGFIGLAVEGAARVARVHLGRLGTHLAEPVKEVGQVGDDVRSILRRARRPAKATGVQTGRTVEGAGVQPLGEVLEQTVGVALARVGLQVFEEHPHRAGHFRHPGQAAVVAAVQAIVQQGLQHPRRGQ